VEVQRDFPAKTVSDDDVGRALEPPAQVDQVRCALLHGVLGQHAAVRHARGVRFAVAALVHQQELPRREMREELARERHPVAPRAEDAVQNNSNLAVRVHVVQLGGHRVLVCVLRRVLGVELHARDARTTAREGGSGVSARRGSNGAKPQERAQTPGSTGQPTCVARGEGRLGQRTR